MIRPHQIIAAKRDRRRLERHEIDAFVAGVTDGSVSDAQIAAFTMAVLLNDVDATECGHLTRAMAASGERLDWSDLPGPVVDKHSTGGVGDKVSLLLAPILAACGAFVPMVSGRGLGHTGGTLDKLEAIPGVCVLIERDRLRRVVREVGCAIVGATDDLAPADRRIYAVRDVTGTVESEALIVASILSKKIAAGVDRLIMDVKVGSGAFLPSPAAADRLGRALIATAASAGLPCRALITCMDQVLGRTAGNALEVREAIDALRDPGEADARLLAVTLALAGELLEMSGLATTAEAGEALARRTLEGGEAAERFARMVKALGGPADLIERPEVHLPRAPVIRPIHATGQGHVTAIDVRALGSLVVSLGGGRRQVGDDVDPSVGLSNPLGLGTCVTSEMPLAVVHAADEEGASHAAEIVRRSYRLAEEPTTGPPLVRGRLVRG